jgi:hypothetical protein
MLNMSTLIASLFDDADADARRVRREIDSIRTRFEAKSERKAHHE